MDEITFTDMEKDLAELMAQEIAKERDAEVLYQLYKTIGWLEINLHKWCDRDEASEIYCWCRDHLTGKHYYMGGGWLFELESDAVLFALRWS